MAPDSSANAHADNSIADRAGVARGFRAMTAAFWLCLLLVLTAWLLPGPANHPRFRVPVEPILSAAAAIGYIGLIQWRRRREHGEEQQQEEA